MISLRNLNRKSLRFRLTLWYTSALCLSLAIIFSSFYLMTRRTLFNYSDSILSSHANKVVEIVKKQEIGMHQYLSDQGFLQEFSAIPGMLVAVMNASGETVTGTVGIDPENVLFKKFFEAVLVAKKPFFSDQNVNGSTMRFLISPVEKNNQFQGVVLVAHPIDIILLSLKSLLMMMGVVFVGLVTLTMIGGYFLARIGIQPVVSLSQKLKRIDTQNLDERIINPETGDEIEELVHAFNDLLDRLRETIKREHEFIVNVAHELKTPLAVFQSSVELALFKEESHEGYKKVLSELLWEIKKTSVMFSKILELAWSKAERLKTRGTIFDFSELIRELQDLAEKMSLAKEITISVDIASGVKLFGEKDKLAKAILNLLDNAIKFTPNHGQIHLTLQTEETHILLKVRDNGLGIAQKDLPHLFEPFYRGLGLAITRGIIEAHQGTIKIESEAGKGTTVSVTLPVSSK